VAKYAPPEKIAVKALQAGADILLMPENPVVAIHSIIEAVEKGEISEHRIDESLQRVSKAKEKLFKSQESFSFVDISTNDSQQVINEILVKSNQTSVLKPIVGLL